MIVLGISAFYHDSAAAIIVDGAIIAAAQEERFTRIKHDNSFPKYAVEFCLQQAGVEIDKLDKIMFYEDPELKYKRLKETYFKFFPKTIPLIFKTLPSWLFTKRAWKKKIKNDFNSSFNVSIDNNLLDNIPHHRSHAASAFYPSPFENAAILILDGVGEFDTTSLWHGKGNVLKKITSIKFPTSLGLLYSTFTYYTGFKVNSGEYKLMGLAPYGEPKYVDKIKQNLIQINADGTYDLNMEYFNYHLGMEMTNEKFEKLFGEPAREPESKISQFEMDIARSIQEVTEEVMINLAKWAKKMTGEEQLCLAGGVALNCVGNGLLQRSKVFKNIWIQPAAGDAGGALGCALDYYYSKGNERKLNSNNEDSMQGSFLGPEYSDEEIKQRLLSCKAKYTFYEDFNKLADDVADLIVKGNVIGWHQGRMEFGPRALGNRSIIGDPQNREMQSVMNLKIKYRESFRPFAPSILCNKVSEWFETDEMSPYMLLVHPVKKDKRIPMTNEQENLFGIEKLNIRRSIVPSITHVDYSARIQTVDKNVSPRYYALIKKVDEKNDCPIVINTSFNVRGEPVVCSPEDSYRCFMRTEMDVLVIGNYVLKKDEQSSFEDEINWKEEFKLD